MKQLKQYQESQELKESTKIIKWSELSRKLSGSDNSIRPNKVPKKYQKKVDRLIQLLEAWERWAN
jgi:hypothetical protein